MDRIPVSLIDFGVLMGCVNECSFPMDFRGFFKLVLGVMGMLS